MPRHSPITGRLSRRVQAGGGIATLVAAIVLGNLTLSTGAGALESAPLAAGVSVDAGGSVDDGTFVPDTFSTGGYLETKPAAKPSLPNFTATVPHPISDEVWHTARVTGSTTTIPGLVPGASYELRLYFLDWYFTRPGQRVFDVHVQGKPALVDFDIVATAVARGADGQNSFGVERDLTVVADTTGTVTVEFLRGKANQPLINALSLLPA